MEQQDVQAQELAGNACAKSDISEEDEDDNPTLFESLASGPELREHIEKATDFLDKVKAGYKKDGVFSKVLEKPGDYSAFQYREGLLYTNN